MENLKTIFLDIDGTLVYHHGIPNKQTKFSPQILPGVLEKLAEWNMKGYYIVLVTGRRESERSATIRQLEEVGVVYDMLITGIGRGQRVLINDLKPDSEDKTAIAINVIRNTGLSNIEL
jgi:hydroxymethylpyrimidine pyrophosphatase-like HAD family hydrolase